MVLLTPIVSLFACDNEGSQLPSDAAISGPDVGVYRPPPCIALGTAECVGSAAQTRIRFTDQAMLNHACTVPASWSGAPLASSASCAMGCAIEGHEYFGGFDASTFVLDATALCAETVEAQFGNPCDGRSRACIPTRARIAADGTVSGQTYLTCNGGTCEVALPPVLLSEGHDVYLAPCGSTSVATYGVSGATGVVRLAFSTAPANACLIAWDSSTQTAVSGVSHVCLGDWECPEGSLCDDQIALLDSSMPPLAVCKPGPRGTLTPSMLN